MPYITHAYTNMERLRHIVQQSPESCIPYLTDQHFALLYSLRLMHNSESHSTHASIHLNAFLLKLRSRLIYLPHKLRVRVGDVVEREDAVAEFEEEEGGEGDECPKR